MKTETAEPSVRERIEAALDAGPTDGPWTAHFEEAYFVRGPDQGRLAMAQNLKGLHGMGGRRSGNESAANIKLIAACNPSNMREVLATIQSQGAEIERLRSEMRRYLPVLERLEAMPSAWIELTAGTGIATLNSYRFALTTTKGQS